MRLSLAWRRIYQTDLVRQKWWGMDMMLVWNIREHSKSRKFETCIGQKDGKLEVIFLPSVAAPSFRIIWQGRGEIRSDL